MNAAGFGVGLVFGFAIAGARLMDYDVIHRMLLFQELDVFLLMASAIAVAAPLLWVLERMRWRTPLAGPINVVKAPVQQKTILGAIVFGAGWALAGTCPGPALVMTASGNVLGIVVMAGIVGGIYLCERLGRLAPRLAPATHAPSPQKVAA